MARFECIVCGWIYDESKGDPEHGVPVGTLWQDVPEDWLCPDCGVGKEDFEAIKEESVAAVPHHQVHGSVLDVEDVGERPENIVASQVSKRVVAPLEIVDVEDDEYEGPSSAGRCDLLVEVDLQAPTVG